MARIRLVGIKMHLDALEIFSGYRGGKYSDSRDFSNRFISAPDPCEVALAFGSDFRRREFAAKQGLAS